MTYRYLYIAAVLILLNNCKVSAQAPWCANEYHEFKTALLQEEGVKEVKFLERKYRNGQVRSRSIAVQYHDDAPNMYWCVGQSICYHESGNLQCISYVDPSSRMSIDSMRCFDEWGELVRIEIYPSYQKDSVLIEIVSGSIFNRFRCHHFAPNTYKEILYQDGVAQKVAHFKFFHGKGYLLDGETVQMDSQGEPERVIRYEKGKAVEEYTPPKMSPSF